MKSRLSVVVITRNEEQDLPACLKSLDGLEAEIVVLDNHSTDQTRAIVYVGTKSPTEFSEASSLPLSTATKY